MPYTIKIYSGHSKTYLSQELILFCNANHIFPITIMLLQIYEIYYNRRNSIFTNYKKKFHWIKYVNSLQTLTKVDEFDKSLITRTTTRITTILRPLPQYLLAVKKAKIFARDFLSPVSKKFPGGIYNGENVCTK